MLTLSHRWAGTILALAVLAAYAATLAPGVYWGDSAQIQLTAADPVFRFDARGYPLLTLLVAAAYRTMPVTPALAANLFSALAGAAAAGLVFMYVVRITGSRLAALASGTTLAVAHLHWSSSVVAEAYSLASLFIAAILTLAFHAAAGSGRAAFGLGVAFGLSFFHHRMLLVCDLAVYLALLFSPAIRCHFLKFLLRSVGGLLVGFLPAAIAFMLFSGQPGPSLSLKSFFLGTFTIGDPNAAAAPGGILALLAYEARFLIYNMIGPQAPLSVLGLLSRGSRLHEARPHLLAIFLAGVGMPILFPHIGDRYVLLLPAVVAGSILTGFGVLSLRRTRFRRLSPVLVALLALLPPVVYLTLANAGLPARLGFFRGADRYHVRSVLWPPKPGDDGPRDYAKAVLELCPPDSIILAGWGEGQVLIYIREVDHCRPDVSVEMRYGDTWASHLTRYGPDRPILLSSYPHIAAALRCPPGYRLEQILPSSLWRIHRD